MKFMRTVISIVSKSYEIALCIVIFNYAFLMYRPSHITRMTKEETSEVEEAQPASEFISPSHEPRKKPIVHPSAQAPLPKDYGGFLI